jgi:DNA-binding PadR family transcriptional regulator
MEVLEIKTSRKEYERLMKTMKKLGLNPSINYTITEKGRKHLQRLKYEVKPYDYSLFGKRRTHSARKEEIQRLVLSIFEEKGPINLIELRNYMHEKGYRLYYSYIAEMIETNLISNLL